MFLGIDWGGTYIKIGAVGKRGKCLSKRVFSSQHLKEKEVFIKKIKELVTSLKLKRIKAIGIGAPGIINVDKGFIYYLPNISGWENYPLKRVLEKKLGLPVFIDNDANVFARAESCFGAARGIKRAIFLTLGTGLGGALIIDGKIFRGRTSAAELGHFPISLKGRKCGCGGKGCIETFVGNKYMTDRYRQLKKKNVSVEAEEIFKKALAGDKVALLVWKEFSYALGMFLSGMINIFNPELIVFGGGVSGAFRIFKSLVQEVIRHQAMWPQAKNVKLVRSRLKNAGIIGAALLAQDNFLH